MMKCFQIIQGRSFYFVLQHPVFDIRYSEPPIELPRYLWELAATNSTQPPL